MNPPNREDFNDFWERQDSVRWFVLIDNFIQVKDPPQFKVYGRALEWGYPTGVGWRPVDLFQSHYLMQLCDLDEAKRGIFLGAMLQ